MTALLLLSFVSLVALSLGYCTYTKNGTLDTLDDTSPRRCQVNMDCMCPPGLTWLPAHNLNGNLNCQSFVNIYLPGWDNGGGIVSESSFTCWNVTKQIPGDTAHCDELLQAVGTIFPRYCCGSATVEPGRFFQDTQNQTVDFGTACDLATGCKLGRNSFLNEISQSNSSCWDASNRRLVQTCECVKASFYFAQNTSDCSQGDDQWSEMVELVENTCQEECTTALQTCAITYECDQINSNATETCDCFTNIVTCMTNTTSKCTPGNLVYDKFRNKTDQNCESTESKCTAALDACYIGHRDKCDTNRTRAEACLCWKGIEGCMGSSDCSMADPLFSRLQDRTKNYCETDAPTATPTAEITETPQKMSSSVQTTVSVACLLVTMVLMVTVL